MSSAPDLQKIRIRFSSAGAELEDAAQSRNCDVVCSDHALHEHHVARRTQNVGFALYPCADGRRREVINLKADRWQKASPAKRLIHRRVRQQRIGKGGKHAAVQYTTQIGVMFGDAKSKQQMFVRPLGVKARIATGETAANVRGNKPGRRVIRRRGTFVYWWLQELTFIGWNIT